MTAFAIIVLAMTIGWTLYETRHQDGTVQKLKDKGTWK